jgi:hypothetical protein
VDAGAVAQIGSAVFTAITATAALLAIRQAKQQTRTNREALETETQPLITDVPRGLRQEARGLDARTRQPTGWEDAGQIHIGTSGAEPLCSASVPVRNVGNGTARIDTITFKAYDGEAPGSVNSPVVPPGEITRVNLACLPGEAGSLAAESIALELRDFSIVIDYSDASGRHRGSLRLDVANGQYPYVAIAHGVANVLMLSKHRRSWSITTGRPASSVTARYRHEGLKAYTGMLQIAPVAPNWRGKPSVAV